MKKKKLIALIRNIVQEELKRDNYSRHYGRINLFESLAADTPSRYITNKMLRVARIKPLPLEQSEGNLDASIT